MTDALTPMMRQYYELKAQVSDAILFFRMGDFYEIFGEDAAKVAPILSIVLTSREKGEGERIPFCGVPHHSARTYWFKLLRAGYKVAIADQIEDPKHAKGLVKRDVTKILTPALSDEIDFIEGADQERLLAALLEDPENKKWVLCLCDMSTGDLRTGDFDNLESAIKMLQKLAPKELLLRQFQLSSIRGNFENADAFDKLVFSTIGETILRDRDAQKNLLSESFSHDYLDTWWGRKNSNFQNIVAAVFFHLKACKHPISHFRVIKPLIDPLTLNLDEIATRDLEIFETMRRRSIEGSLFFEINACLTPMGARRLRTYLRQPLLDINQICARQNCISEFVDNAALLAEFRKSFDKIPDLDRLATRIIARSVTPSELKFLRQGLYEIGKLTTQNKCPSSVKSQLLNDLIKGMTGFEKTYSILQNALTEEPESFGEGDRVFNLSHSPDLEKWFHLKNSSTELITRYETSLRQSSGISSLKVRHHKSYGLLIEVTKTHLNKVPPTFIKRQSMVNNERFTTPDLQTLNDELSTAQENILALEHELYQSLLNTLNQDIRQIQDLSTFVAEIDVLQGLAFKAVKDHYVCPRTNDSGILNLNGVRHPVVERFVGKHRYVANSISLAEDKNCVLITGPNMGGKSTFMRQTALVAVLHQIGSFVPATAADLPIFDAIYTRVGASDDLAHGQSTFFIEMLETARILRFATSKSLVILDEVGRGTSTTDGSAIALAVFNELSQKIRCFTLFATHFHELVQQTAHIKNRVLKHTEVVNEGGSLKFSHRLIDGFATSSYGIDVARLAGIPESVVLEAGRFLCEQSAGSPTVSVEIPLTAPIPLASPLCASPDSRLEAVSHRLRGLKIQRTTPLSALNILNDLKVLLDSEPTGQPSLWD